MTFQTNNEQQAFDFLDIHYRPALDKIYLRPVGLLTGDTGRIFLENGHALPLAVGDIYFTHCHVIIRSKQGKISNILVSSTVLSHLSDRYQRIASLLDRLSSPYLLHRKYHLPKRSVMGILNYTPDSFSDGGRYQTISAALTHAEKMISHGIDFLDIGGESTRPGAKELSPKEEMNRVLPLLEKLIPLCEKAGVLTSLDSRHSAVMEQASLMGVDLLNDISAFEHEAESPDIAAKSGALLCLMHMQGSPETMQLSPSYQQTVLDIFDYLEDRIHTLRALGVSMAKMIADPGIGFGKTDNDTQMILSWTPLFLALGVPLLYGTSRKSFIGRLAGDAETGNRLAGSLISGIKTFEMGGSILRVHDTEETKQAVKMCDFLLEKS